MNNRVWSSWPIAIVACAMMGQAAYAQSTSAPQQLERFSSLAGAAGDAARGQKIFVDKASKDMSCASCHGLPPSGVGRHASTGKTIEPLAPAFNAKRFTDQAKVDKWFRRNCNDVFARECTPAQKADLMAYLISIKP